MFRILPRALGDPTLRTDRLDAEQRADFARDGYLVVRGVVDRPAIDVALQTVNHWLDTGFDSTRRAHYYGEGFAPEHAEDPEIVGLLTDSGAVEIAASLVGRPLVVSPPVQIALRFPGAHGDDRADPWAHLDGVAASLNGVPDDGQIHGFTALTGVFLSDCPPGDHGNFTVWPGSHLATARWFRDHGTSVADAEAFGEAMHELADATSPPRALDVRAGDVVLAHSLLLHSAGPHRGPAIRYAVYFRLKTAAHDAISRKTLTNPWYEWPAYRRDGGPSTIHRLARWTSGHTRQRS